MAWLGLLGLSQVTSSTGAPLTPPAWLTFLMASVGAYLTPSPYEATAPLSGRMKPTLSEAPAGFWAAAGAEVAAGATGVAGVQAASVRTSSPSNRGARIISPITRRCRRPVYRPSGRTA